MYAYTSSFVHQSCPALGNSKKHGHINRLTRLSSWCKNRTQHCILHRNNTLVKIILDAFRKSGYFIQRRGVPSWVSLLFNQSIGPPARVITERHDGLEKLFLRNLTGIVHRAPCRSFLPYGRFVRLALTLYACVNVAMCAQAGGWLDTSLRFLVECDALRQCPVLSKRSPTKSSIVP